MQKIVSLFFFLSFSFAILAFCFDEDDDAARLFQDLAVVDYWNQKLSRRLPVTYNHLFQGGYLVMPSSRMGHEGEVGFGYTSLPPYSLYNLRLQFLNRLEISGNYRIYRGIEDPILSQYGFGDLSDKGANIKFALLHPEDSDYRYPGVAIGTEDFIGTKGFHARYIVFTKVFWSSHFEASLGWGWRRYRGFFGGFSWFPFFRHKSPYVRPISVVAEWDATRYRDSDIEKHPKGRKQRSPINIGLKYRFLNFFDFTVSYVRGKEWAFSASASYNLGCTKGFFPKIHDPLPYRAPVNYQEIGIYRPHDVVIQDMVTAFRWQGFEILEARETFDFCKNRILWLRVDNTKYRLEKDVRERITCLLSALVPSNVQKMIVVMEAEGMPIQQYQFETTNLLDFGSKEISSYQMEVLSPLTEVAMPAFYQVIFKRPRNFFNIEVFPKSHTLFGSAKGKFKYALGLAVSFNGFLGNDVFYSIEIGSLFLSDMHGIKDYDRLNPSQLINVRTDSIRYLQNKSITLDQAYLQKNWNLGKGFFFKASGGYFEYAYGGGALELLYFPLYSPVAIGIEGAIVKKRHYKGVTFSRKIRKLIGTKPIHENFLGSQYFINAYFQWYKQNLDFHIQAGKFLANDYGVRYVLSRYFPSGLQVYIWYTWTNGNDKVNSHTYHDKGVGFSMPLDILYTYSSRSRTYYELAAWLRDVGARAYTGRSLYEILNENRQ